MSFVYGTPHQDLTETWQTIAFTALPPGWVNVYQSTSGYRAKPCPGVLVQERLKHTGYGLTERRTRAVYAASDYASLGELHAALLHPEYRRTVNDPDWAALFPRNETWATRFPRTETP